MSADAETKRPLQGRPMLGIFLVVLNAILLAGTVCFFWLDLKHARGSVGEMYAESVEGLDLIGELQYQTQEARRSMQYALTTRDPNRQIQYVDQSRAVDEEISSILERQHLFQTGQRLEHELPSDWKKYQEVRDEVIASILEGSIDEGIERDLRDGIPAFDRVRDDLTAIKTGYRKSAQERVATVDAVFEGSITRLVVILG